MMVRIRLQVPWGYSVMGTRIYRTDVIAVQICITPLVDFEVNEELFYGEFAVGEVVY